MADVVCENCGTLMVPVPGCVHLCAKCGLAYAFQWRLTGGTRLETVVWKCAYPSREERTRQLSALLEQKRAILRELAETAGLFQLKRRRDLKRALALLQRQIDARLGWNGCPTP